MATFDHTRKCALHPVSYTHLDVYKRQDINWRPQAPEGKLDMLLTLDFRMTSSTLMSDVILPAATWYEKHDINTTDMHPFIHPFTPAINPPWQAKTDWDIFGLLANKLSEFAVTHLGTRTDAVAVPLMHDSPDAMATPHGQVRDWKTGEVDPCLLYTSRCV